jgi:hypothetical protein
MLVLMHTRVCGIPARYKSEAPSKRVHTHKMHALKQLPLQYQVKTTEGTIRRAQALLARPHAAVVLLYPSPTMTRIYIYTHTAERNYDWVRVFQCTSIDCSNRNLIGELTGVISGQRNVTSATGYALVHFTTDGSVTASGFDAVWSSYTTVGGLVLGICTYIHSVRERTIWHTDCT